MENKYLDYEGLVKLLNDLYNGTITVGKAKADKDGNQIDTTYVKLNDYINHLAAELINKNNTDALSGKVDNITNLLNILSGVVDTNKLNNQLTIKDINSSIDTLSGKINTLDDVNSDINTISGKLTEIDLVSGQLIILRSLLDQYQLLTSGSIDTLKNDLSGTNYDLTELTSKVNTNTDNIEYISGILKDVGPELFEYMTYVSGYIQDLYDKVANAVTVDLSGQVWTNADNIEWISGLLDKVNPNSYEIFRDQVSGQIMELFEKVSGVVYTKYDWVSGALIDVADTIEWISGQLNQIDPNTLSLLVDLSSELSGAVETSKNNADILSGLKNDVYTNTLDIKELSGNIDYLSGIMNDLSGNLYTTSTDLDNLSAKLLDVESKIVDNDAISGQLSEFADTLSGLIADTNESIDAISARVYILESIDHNIYITKDELQDTLSAIIDDSKYDDSEISETVDELINKVDDISGIVNQILSENSTNIDKLEELSGKIEEHTNEISGIINNVDSLESGIVSLQDLFNERPWLKDINIDIDQLSGMLAKVDTLDVQPISSGEIYNLWTSVFK